MQMKKLLGIAMAAALVGSMATVAATSVSAQVVDGIDSVGVIGALTGGWDSDVDMADEDGDGIYTLVVKDVPANVEQTFKIRGNDNWDDGLEWALFDAEKGTTCNPGSPNITFTLEAVSDVTVELDTTSGADNYDKWPVTYSYVDKDGQTQRVFLGDPDAMPEPKPEPASKGLPEGIDSVGVIGDLVGGWAADVDMADDDGDGIYTLVVKGVPAGVEQTFKIRGNDNWDDGLEWALFDAEKGTTCNPGSPNITFTLEVESDVTVELDTNGEDYDKWPVTYSYVDKDGQTQRVFLGNPNPDSKPDDTKTDDTKTDDTKTDDTKTDDTKTDDAATTRQTERNEYIYFDNTSTQWEEVYAYWWDDAYGRTYDKISGEDYGWVPGVNEAGEPDNKPLAFPGTKMTKVEGTNIWQCRIPFGAKFVIFNSGKTDAQVREGVEAYQSADLPFDEVANAGQVYAVDLASGKKGVMKMKTKTTYQEGAWTAYDGPYTAEEVAVPTEDDKKQDDQKQDDQKKDDQKKDDQKQNNTDTPVPSNQPSVPTTGDATMPVAFAIVALAAAGAVVVLAKKKVQD